MVIYLKYIRWQQLDRPMSSRGWLMMYVCMFDGLYSTAINKTATIGGRWNNTLQLFPTPTTGSD